MPKAKDIKPPMQKRVEGAIYRDERLEEKRAAVKVLTIAKRQHRPVCVIIKDPHTMIEKKVYYGSQKH